MSFTARDKVLPKREGSVRSLTSIFEEKAQPGPGQRISERGRIMSFHSTYNSRVVSAPLPQPAVQRKPYTSSMRSVSPLPPGPSPNHAHSNSSTMHAPLQSFPPQAPVTPSITPPVPSPSIGPAQVNHTSSHLKPLSNQEIESAFGSCLRLQNEAVSEHGKRPFAALLLGPDNVTVLASHNSISHYQHAESELARLAAIQYSGKYLEQCTLVSTWEPCAMCSGTIYWSNIGRVLYAASESKLKELTGSGNSENMTMSLPCRVVFDAGQRKVDVIGPVPEWEQRVVESCSKWWKDHNNAQEDLSKSTNSMKDTSSIYSKRTSITIYNPEDSYLGSIGEDGEYSADLKIDWMP